MKKIILVGILSLTSLVSSAQNDEAALVSKHSFSFLFNNYRVAQPNVIPWAGSYFAYSNNGTAIGINGNERSKEDSAHSPMAKYDKLFNGGQTLATDFEKANHTCDIETFDEETKSSCRGWWGHCNGWAAAALKEKEPRTTKTYKGEKLEVGHQKGLLTEMWLSTQSYFVGTTDKTRKTGQWIFNVEDPQYKAFWDVTPRQFFLIFTNQLGIQKMGVAIDRYTGDQVWNQPVAGYRILPFRKEDVGIKEVNGLKLNYLNVRMKIYWADDGVLENHVSSKFDINSMSDLEMDDNVPRDYVMRMLEFKLFFDRPVVISSDGKKIEGDPMMVHDGLWKAQEMEENFYVDQTHPDFIWQPINPFITQNGYANHFIDPKLVRKLFNDIESDVGGAASPPEANQPARPSNPPSAPTTSSTTTTTTSTTTPRPPQPPEPPSGGNSDGIRETSNPAEIFIVVDDPRIGSMNRDIMQARSFVTDVLYRASLGGIVSPLSIQFQGGNQLRFSIINNRSQSVESFKKAFQDAGIKILSFEGR